MQSIAKKMMLVVLMSVAFTFSANAQISDYLKSFLNLDDATIVRQEVPAIVNSGESVPVTVTIRNTGLRTWDIGEGYHLMVYTDNSPYTNTWGIGSVDLPVSVSKFEDITLTFTLTAPTNPGTHSFRLSMAKDGVMFGDASAPIAINVTGSRRYYTDDDRRFDDRYGSRPGFATSYVKMSYPDVMFPGERYPISIVMRNTGSTTWVPSYMTDRYNQIRLVPVASRSSIGWGVSSVVLDKTVRPGEDAEFNFYVTAPNTPGVYEMGWALLNGDRQIGESTPTATVEVRGRMAEDLIDIGNSSLYRDMYVPSIMRMNSSYDINVSMRNNGTSTWRRGTHYLESSSPSMGTYYPWGVSRVDLPYDVRPGETAVFNFRVKSPDRPGIYSMQWQMVGNGVTFGDATPVRTVEVR